MSFFATVRERLISLTTRVPVPTVIYEHNDVLPIFVYGTLRPTEGNYGWALAGKTDREIEGSLANTSMYSNGGFPYVIEDGGNGVVGTLVYVKNEDLEEVMNSLDMLEGTSHGIENDMNHYNRYKRFIEVAENHYVEAWVYMPPRVDYDRIRSLNSHLEHGDWYQRTKMVPKTVYHSK